MGEVRKDFCIDKYMITNSSVHDKDNDIHKYISRRYTTLYKGLKQLQNRPWKKKQYVQA